MAVLPAGADKTMQKANLTSVVLEFMKKSSNGAPCVFVNETTKERVRTAYTIDKNLNYLIILSPKPEESALAVCPLALISDVYSVEQDGEQAFPKGLLEQLADAERNMLAMVLYRKEAKDRRFVRLCFVDESREARDKFLISIRVLSVYAKNVLKSRAANKSFSDFTSFLSCFACCGRNSQDCHMRGMQLVEGIDTSFQIYLPQHLQGAVDQDEIDNNQVRVDSDGRIHVVWSLGDSQIRNHDGHDSAQTFYRGRPLSDDEAGGSDKENIPSCLEEPPNEALDLPIMCMDARGKTREVKPNVWRLQHAKLFVADGYRMEYYSATHKRWSPATVRVEASSDIHVGVTYNAVLSKDQERKDVMRFLRRPFDTDDLVEVFLNVFHVSNQNSDYKLAEEPRWLAGRIPSTPDKSASHVGYAVQLDVSGEILECVPSFRIRQRYPRGQLVYVYKGLTEGWTPGVVHDSSSLDGLGARCYKLNGFEYKGELTKATPIKDKPSSNAVGTSQQKRFKALQRQMSGQMSERESSFCDCEIDPWVLVPVIVDGACQDFPSYLVRRRVELVTV